MNLKELIDSKLGEFEKGFGPRMFHPFTESQLKGGAIMKKWVGETIKESIEAYQKAVEVEKNGTYLLGKEVSVNNFSSGWCAAMEETKKIAKEFMGVEPPQPK